MGSGSAFTALPALQMNNMEGRVVAVFQFSSKFNPPLLNFRKVSLLVSVFEEKEAEVRSPPFPPPPPPSFRSSPTHSTSPKNPRRNSVMSTEPLPSRSNTARIALSSPWLARTLKLSRSCSANAVGSSAPWFSTGVRVRVS